jgi:predicted transcriptional regulator
MKKTRGVDLKVNSEAYNILENTITGSGKKMMLSIFRLMTKDTNIITINGATLDEICSETKLSQQQVRDKVSELKKHGLIEPTGALRAEYIVNPTLAIKGSEIKVWREYGKLERNNNPNTTIMAEGVVLDGKELPLREEDFIIYGKEEHKKRNQKG